MIMVVALAFLVAWSPFYFVTLISQLQPQEDNFLRRSNYVFYMLVIHFFGFLNSCVNPFIYAVMSEKFRRSFRQIIGSFMCCCCCFRRLGHYQLGFPARSDAMSHSGSEYDGESRIEQTQVKSFYSISSKNGDSFQRILKRLSPNSTKLDNNSKMTTQRSSARGCLLGSRISEESGTKEESGTPEVAGSRHIGPDTEAQVLQVDGSLSSEDCATYNNVFPRTGSDVKLILDSPCTVDLHSKSKEGRTNDRHGPLTSTNEQQALVFDESTARPASHPISKRATNNTSSTESNVWIPMRKFNSEPVQRKSSSRNSGRASRSNEGQQWTHRNGHSTKQETASDVDIPYDMKENPGFGKRDKAKA